MRFFYLPIEKSGFQSDDAKPDYELEKMDLFFYLELYAAQSAKDTNSKNNEIPTSIDHFLKQNTENFKTKPKIDFTKLNIFFNEYSKIQRFISDKEGDFTLVPNAINNPYMLIHEIDIKRWFKNISIWKKNLIREIENLTLKNKQDYVKSTKTKYSNHIKRLEKIVKDIDQAIILCAFIYKTFSFVRDNLKIVNETTVICEVDQYGNKSLDSDNTYNFKVEDLLVRYDLSKGGEKPLFADMQWWKIKNSIFDLWKVCRAENRDLFNKHHSNNKLRDKKNESWKLRKVVESLYYSAVCISKNNSALQLSCQEPYDVISTGHNNHKRFDFSRVPDSKKWWSEKEIKTRVENGE